MSAKHCVHYTYVGAPDGGGPKCAIGIDIEANYRPLWPCMSGNAPPESSAKCPQFVAPTPEQLAEQKRQAEESAARMFTALVSIDCYEEQNGERIGTVVAIKCPCCGIDNALRFARTTRSLVAKCDTPKCVEFRGSSRR